MDSFSIFFFLTVLIILDTRPGSKGRSPVTCLQMKSGESTHWTKDLNVEKIDFY